MSKQSRTRQYPQFYRIDFDIYVKVEYKDGYISAINHHGNSVELGRVLEGEKITQEAFRRAVSAASSKYC